MSSIAKPACTCWTTMEEQLKPKGFQISNACSALVMEGNSLEVRRYLPLQRTDGKKPRVGDAKGIAISHCPFCGQALKP